MPNLFHCPQGHCWEDEIGADAPTTDRSLERTGPVCPVCGRTPEMDLPVLPGYEVLHCLGGGSMGQVFKARHLRLDRIVALKVIRPALVANPDALQRFHREAQAAARLSHPNVVGVYDAAEANGIHYLSMEYVEGVNLATWVQELGPMPYGQACDYVRQAALGLQHAHERGLVHRDIKPANLLLAAQGAVAKVVDMGLARLKPGGPTGQPVGELTHEGAIMGTPAYLAPEQARDARTADIRADLYSLGCTLYYLLSGRVPFPGASLAEIILKHQSEQPEPLSQSRPEVPEGVQAIVTKLLAKRPEDRYPTPGELAEALAPFCVLNPSNPAAGRQQRARLLGLPQGRWLVGAAVTAIALAILGLLAWHPWRRAETNGAPLEPSLSQPAALAGSGSEAGRGPKNAEECLRRGRAFCDKNEYDRAIADLDHAIQLDPKSAEAY